jgi:hypothetical protein
MVISKQIIVVPVSESKSITVIESGWLDHYHVILEDGENIKAIHGLMSRTQLIKEHNIDVAVELNMN